MILAVIVTIACLKTAVGLITSCGATFERMFPGSLSYRIWAVVFCLVSFILANLGLDAIIRYSRPVLMLLYPLAVTLILLTLSGRFFEYDKVVYQWVTVFTAVAAAVDFFNALPDGAASAPACGSGRTGCGAVPAVLRPGVRMGLPGGAGTDCGPGGKSREKTGAAASGHSVMQKRKD